MGLLKDFWNLDTFDFLDVETVILILGTFLVKIILGFTNFPVLDGANSSWNLVLHWLLGDDTLPLHHIGTNLLWSTDTFLPRYRDVGRHWGFLAHLLWNCFTNPFAFGQLEMRDGTDGFVGTAPWLVRRMDWG